MANERKIHEIVLKIGEKVTFNQLTVVKRYKRWRVREFDEFK